MKIVDKESFRERTRNFVEQVLMAASAEFLRRGGSPEYLSAKNINKVTDQIVDAFHFMWDESDEILKH